MNILIFEWNRPRYLAVCLESLRRAKCRYPITVSVDGGHSSTNRQFLDVVSWYRVDMPISLLIYGDRLGNRDHVIESCRDLCASLPKSEEVLFLDGDCIIRTDTFGYLQSAPRDSLWLSLASRNGGQSHAEWFNPLGNLTTAEALREVIHYCNGDQWIGKDRPGSKIPMDETYPGYDAIFCRFTVDSGHRTRFAPIPYLAHLGVSGVDQPMQEAIDKEMFDGEPHKWLDQCIAAFKKHPEIKAFIPREFTYA